MGVDRGKVQISKQLYLWHTLSITELLRDLESNTSGLLTEEVMKRQTKYGKNVLPHKEPDTIGIIFIRQFFNPLIYILIAAAGASFFIGKASDAGFIFAVLLFNAIVGGYQEWSAERSSAALLNLLKLMARVRREGGEQEIEAEQLVPGDIVLVESGNKVPADLRLIMVNNLLVDESLLTGESVATSKSVEALFSEIGVSDQKNMIFAGSTITAGRGMGVVTATGLQTEVGKIAKAIMSEGSARPPLVIRMEKFTKQISVAILAACAVLGFYEIMAGKAIQEVFLIVVALAVSAIPEGLPIAMTVALSLATQRMAKRHVIVRKLTAVEGLGSCTCIASDKTGTLTVNKQTVKSLFLYPDVKLQVEGEGYNDQGGIVADRNDFMEDASIQNELLEMARVGILCNEASLWRSDSDWSYSGDAVDVSFLALGYKVGLRPDEVRESVEMLATIPFESERKYAAQFYQDQGVVKVAVKGAAEAIIKMCVCDWAGERVCGPFDPQKAEQETRELSRNGFRVLALAVGEVPLKEDGNYAEEDIQNLSFLALAGLVDPLRPEARNAVDICHEAGVKVVMITGDHPDTSFSIGKQLGIVRSTEELMTGAEVEDVSKGPMNQYLARIASTRVFARVTPLQKLQIVEAYIASGNFIAVTGDGANDAPAIRKANIGVAMGSGTDLAKESADIILTDDNFASIVAGIEEGRYAYDNLRKVILFLISTGFGLILFFMLALFTDLPVPLLAVQLLWLNLVANGMQDVALAFENGEVGAMKQKPRQPTEGVFDKTMTNQVLLAGLVIGGSCYALWHWLMATGYPLVEARGIALLTLIWIGNLHALNCRSESSSVFKIPLQNNKLLVAGVVFTHTLHIVATQAPFFQSVLSLTPITLEQWLTSLMIAFIIVVAMEIYKKVRTLA